MKGRGKGRLAYNHPSLASFCGSPNLGLKLELTLLLAASRTSSTHVGYEFPASGIPTASNRTSMPSIAQSLAREHRAALPCARVFPNTLYVQPPHHIAQARHYTVLRHRGHKLEAPYRASIQTGPICIVSKTIGQIRLLVLRFPSHK